MLTAAEARTSMIVAQTISTGASIGEMPGTWRASSRQAATEIATPARPPTAIKRSAFRVSRKITACHKHIQPETTQPGLSRIPKVLKPEKILDRPQYRVV